MRSNQIENRDPPPFPLSRETSSLEHKYGVDPKACEEHNQRFAAMGYIELFGGIGLVLLGWVMAHSSDTIFYGAVWVGVELVLLAICRLLNDMEWDDIPAAGKILITIVSAAVALVFAFGRL